VSTTDPAALPDPAGPAGPAQQPGIRAAVAGDVEVLVQLIRSAYRGPESRTGWTTEADLLDDERIDAGQVLEKISAPEGVMLVCRTGGEVLGCCEVAHRGNGLAYFGTFAVRPAHQAAGLGRLLLAAAEDHARTQWAAGTMELTVIAGRTELIEWYQRRGYRRTGETRPFPLDQLINGHALVPGLHFQVLAKRLDRGQATGGALPAGAVDGEAGGVLGHPGIPDVT
jgi:ribosomal protein S18 acetylase RimI-like enzyme